MPYEYGGKNTAMFAKLPGYKNLVAWQKGSDLSALINEAVKHFGPGYFRLIDQMRGAAISITVNIAEGYCSASIGNSIRYCLTARGSLGELGSYIQDCERWGLIKGEALDRIASIYSDATFLLDRLIQSLRQKEQDGTWDKQFWIKEEQETYDVNPESWFPHFPHFPYFLHFLAFLRFPCQTFSNSNPSTPSSVNSTYWKVLRCPSPKAASPRSWVAMARAKRRR